MTIDKTITAIFLLLLFSCGKKSDGAQTPTDKGIDLKIKKKDNEKDSIRILVLIPYDNIANLGSSPDIEGILEKVLLDKENFKIIPFPLKKLMGVSYQQVYDKKYCKPIVEKVDCDIIVMSQIITKGESDPGFWPRPWNYRTKILNVRTDKQMESINGENLEAGDFKKDITGKSNKLITDILRIYKEK